VKGLLEGLSEGLLGGLEGEFWVGVLVGLGGEGVLAEIRLVWRVPLA